MRIELNYNNEYVQFECNTTNNWTITPYIRAADDYARTEYNTPKIIDILANDTLMGMPVDHITIPDRGTTDGPGHGTVVINPDNTVTYVPDDGFTGVDQFNYTVYVKDGEGNLYPVTAIVTVVVENIITANDDYKISDKPGVPIVVDVLENDLLPDGYAKNDPRIGIALPSESNDMTKPKYGSAVVSTGEDGRKTVTYTPTDPAWTGVDFFEYEASAATYPDGPVYSDRAFVYIAILDPANAIICEGTDVEQEIRINLLLFPVIN